MKYKLEEVIEIFYKLKDKMEEKKDYLIELDAKLGDGDLGLTMTKVFNSAVESLDNFQGDDIGQALLKTAMSINNAASSTMGTLISSGIMEAGKTVKGKKELTKTDILQMAQAVIEGIKKRGKAEQGDKTILDCLIPAVESLNDKIDSDNTLLEGLNSACKAAEEGVIKTEDMVSQHGRARYYGEDSKGHKDAGAVAALICIKVIRNYVKDN